MRRFSNVALTALTAGQLAPCSSSAQVNNNQSIRVENNNGTIIVNNDGATGTYPGFPPDFEKETIRKIAEVTIAASAKDWTTRLGEALRGLNAQAANTRASLAAAAKRELALQNQVRDLKSRIDTVGAKVERTNAELAEAGRHLEQQEELWTALTTALQESNQVTQDRVDELTHAIDQGNSQIEGIVARATQSTVVDFFAPDPALRVALTFRAESLAFPAISAGLGAAYAWSLSTNVRLGPSFGVGYCCLGPSSRTGGFLGPAGNSLEASDYRLERVTFGVGPELRIRRRSWKNLRLVTHALYRHQFVRWQAEDPRPPSESYNAPSVATDGGIDVRLFGPLVFGLFAGAAYDFWRKDPVLRYTGYLGTTTGPARLGGKVSFEGGFHLAATFFD